MGVHVLAVGLLFVVLMPPIKVPDLPAGILVSIGNMAEAEGTYDPHEIIPPEEVDPVEPIPTPPDEDLLTQDLPEAPEVKQVKRQEPKKEPVKKRTPELSWRISAKSVSGKSRRSARLLRLSARQISPVGWQVLWEMLRMHPGRGLPRRARLQGTRALPPVM